MVSLLQRKKMVIFVVKNYSMDLFVDMDEVFADLHYNATHKHDTMLI